MTQSQNSGACVAEKPAATALPIYTIGHSTRTIPEFVALLNVGQVDMVIDIRSIPRSRTNPQYNIDVLPDTLAPWQIAYTQIAELGGRRNKSKTIAPDVNGFWSNQSFHNYADYALSAQFQDGLSRLEGLARDRRCAIMCSEAVWWCCHRRIVADYLLHGATTVFHLMGAGRADRATLTIAAREAGSKMTYPAS